MNPQAQLLKLASEKPLQLALAAVLVIGVVYWLSRKTIDDATDFLGGIFSGDNDLTRGTDYEGKGVAGTLGAGADTVSGGLLSSWGSAIGGKLYEWTHSDAAGESTYYIVTFPDGKRHAIGSQNVDGSGRFSYDGRRYQLFLDDAGVKYARAA